MALRTLRVGCLDGDTKESVDDEAGLVHYTVQRRVVRTDAEATRAR